MSSVPNLPPRGAPSGRAVGFGLAVLGAIAFSGKAILAKLMYGHGVDAVMVLMLRMLFALPIFILIAWWASRGQAALSARQWAGVLFLGFIGYYLSSLLDFVGLQYITASLERLILYLSPTLVVVMSWVTDRTFARTERVRTEVLQAGPRQAHLATQCSH